MKMQSLLRTIDKLLPGCATCSANMQELLCHLTCAPNQDQFIEVLATKPTNDSRKKIDEINYHLNSKFATGLFDSCVKVLMSNPVTGNSTNLASVICDDGKACTYQELFEFMGNK